MSLMLIINLLFSGTHSDANVWHETYDCKLDTEVLFQIVPHLLPADNPQQAEDCSHIGVKGNFNSRRDTIGGTDTQKETFEVYHSLFSVLSLY